MTFRSVFALISITALTFACTSRSEASCISSVGNKNYTMESCTEAKGVSLSIFSKNETTSPSTTAFDRLRVGVATSHDKKALEKAAGIDADQENQHRFLIPIPEKDEIVSWSPLPPGALKTLATEGWKTKAELITYNSQGADGTQFTLACATSSSFDNPIYIVIAKCMPFYPEDINAFRSIIKYVGSHPAQK